MANSESKGKAHIAIVDIGYLTIEGLMFPDNSFGVAVPQIAKLFPYFHDSQNQASQKLKRLMGKEFKTHKFTTVFNRNTTLAVSLDNFLLVLKTLNRLKDPVAVDLIEELIGLSIHQLFCDAFDLQFEKEERQEWLKARQRGKYVRRTFTDAVQDWIKAHARSLSKEDQGFLYANSTNCLYRGLFGRTASKLKKDWNTKELRDNMTLDELIHTEHAEAYACRLLDNLGNRLTPLQAAQKAIDTLLIPVSNR